jgi:hypothetical protein
VRFGVITVVLIKIHIFWFDVLSVIKYIVTNVFEELAVSSIRV